MPVYEIILSAKIILKMEGANPEEAVRNAEALAEDASLSAAFGFDMNIGVYPAKMFLNDSLPRCKRRLPDDTDPKKREEYSVGSYMKDVMGDAEQKEPHCYEI